MNKILDRRNFLKFGIGTAAGAAAFTGFGAKALAASCGLTPPQTPGPFYPGEVNFHPTNDLTIVEGHTRRALGRVVYVMGQVLDPACKPISGANVEIWQACESGRYNNANDPNTAPLDQNFRYWGETNTDAEGHYTFKTIIPGAYPADTNWIRPPHIHFKVSRRGYKDLITQMYFKEAKELNDKDLILQDVPANQRDSVIIDFVASRPDLEPGSQTGQFNITMVPVRPS
ncbi:MAG: dioxygenase family protein [Bdellovibrionota bacterium]